MLKRLDLAFAGFMLLVAGLFAIFIDRLVAPPKMLLGRSLTAIEPSLFPLITIVMMIGLCTVYVVLTLREDETGPSAASVTGDRANWFRIGAFFAILLLYALIFHDVGFLVSTFIAMSLLSLLVGSRNILQILALSTLCPLALYILSTRVLKVSLPELSPIEFAIAAILGG